MTHPMSSKAYRCDNCKVKFPLKQLKRCGACRIPVYCSISCQTVAWKDGHKEVCREVVIEKKLLNGWSYVWEDLLGWTTSHALDLLNTNVSKGGYVFSQTRERIPVITKSKDVRRAYEVLSGRIQAMQMDELVFNETYSRMAKRGPHNRLYLNLIVEGEGGQFIDTASLGWNLPNLVHDTPERSEVQAKYCIDVLKAVVRNSKPRDAIRHGTLAMEAAIMREGLPPAFSIPWA